MGFAAELTDWIAVSAAGLAAAVAMLALFGFLHARRLLLRERGNSEALTRAEDETAQAREEIRRLRVLQGVGSEPELETVLVRALEAASQLTGAPAAMFVLPRSEGEPIVATLGLSTEEAHRGTLGLPPQGDQARAVTMQYSYSDEEAELDEFRLRGGIAVPVQAETDLAGALCVYWRRSEPPSSEAAVEALEDVAVAVSPALGLASRFDTLRLSTDMDDSTGLLTRHALDEHLGRECRRARRYERSLSLLLLAVAGLDPPAAAARLGAAVRASDSSFHLGDGLFAVLIPEGELAGAERLARRLRSAVRADDVASVTGSSVTLEPDDDPDSFFERAEQALDRDREPRQGFGAESSS